MKGPLLGSKAPATHAEVCPKTLPEFTTAIAQLGRSSRWQRALATLPTLTARGLEPSAVTGSALGRALEQGDRWNLAWSLFREFACSGIQTHAVLCNSALVASARASRWALVLAWMATSDVLVAHGVQPNEIAYGALLVASGQRSLWAEAVEVLGDVRRCALEPNVVLYGMTISALSQATDETAKSFWNRAASLLKDLSAHGLRANVVVCTAALGSGSWQSALQLGRRLEVDGSEPTATTCTAQVAACGAQGRWVEALELLSGAQRRLGHLNEITLSACLKACVSSRSWGGALGLMAPSSTVGLATRHMAMDLYCKNSLWAAALNEVGSLLLSGVQPDFVSAIHVLGACERSGNWERAGENMNQSSRVAIIV